MASSRSSIFSLLVASGERGLSAPPLCPKDVPAKVDTGFGHLAFGGEEKREPPAGVVLEDQVVDAVVVVARLGDCLASVVCGGVGLGGFDFQFHVWAPCFDIRIIPKYPIDHTPFVLKRRYFWCRRRSSAAPRACRTSST